MPKEDKAAAQVKHAGEVVEVMFVAGDQTAEALQPGEEAFDSPPPPVTPQRPPVLCAALAIAAVRSDHFHTRFRQLGVQLVGIVSAVADESPHWLGNEGCGEGSLHQGYFMRRSTFRANGDRKTVAIRHCH